MLFGFKGAPLLMGRFAACLARIWQSLVCIKRVVTQHIPGNWNVEADWLSRPHERGPKPERLLKVPIKSFPRNLMRRSYLSPPGVAPNLWGATAQQVSGAFELL